ncbi:MAG: YqgE/AlgH family protein [Planctomycetota bacterium]|nr:YqgE/AlgH family protein [Planctomycetota bacterium]
MKALRTVPGSLLAAAPSLRDENFMHTVVLMCAHGDEGAHGLVINRPSPITIDKLMPAHALLARQHNVVHAGGPVGLDTLQFVHRVPGRIAGGVELSSGIHLGGDIDQLAQFLEERGESAAEDVRLILGYAGWGAGQLEEELAGGSWIPVSLQPEWVFAPDSQGVWRQVVRSLGGAAAGLEDLPPDVSWN